MPTRFKSNKTVKAALASAKSEVSSSVKGGLSDFKTKVKRGTAGARDSVLQKFGIVNLRTAPKISYAIRRAVCDVELKGFKTYYKDYRKFVKICKDIDGKLKKDEQAASKSDANFAEALLPPVAQIDKQISEIKKQIRELEEQGSPEDQLDILQELKDKSDFKDLNELVKELKQIKKPRRGAYKSDKQQKLEALLKNIRDQRKLESELKTFEQIKRTGTNKDELSDLKDKLNALKTLKSGGAAGGKKLVEDFRSAVNLLIKLGSKVVGQNSKIKKYQANLDAKREEISKLTDEGKADRIQKSLENFSKSFYLIHKSKFFKEYEKVADAAFDSIIKLREVTDRDKIKLLKSMEKFQLVSIQQQLFAVGNIKKEHAELEDFVKREIRALNDKTWKIFRKEEGKT